MEYTNEVDELRGRRRTRCRICGEPIQFEEPFYTDGYTMEHLYCFFEQQEEKV